jgi:hypothetical protein
VKKSGLLREWERTAADEPVGPGASR